MKKGRNYKFYFSGFYQEEINKQLLAFKANKDPLKQKSVIN